MTSNADPEMPAGENWFKVAGKGVQQMVIEDVQERERHGITTYGVAIYAGTQDDPVEGGPIGQAYREALDLVVYLRWQIARHENDSSGFAFGALQSIKAGSWDKYLDQLTGAIKLRRKQIRE